MNDAKGWRRVLAFENLHNFRDYGGYGAAGGGRLRTGLLYRSAQHRDASEADLARVSDLGLNVVIDLRNDGEREISPCPRPDGFAARVLFAPDAVEQAAPHIEAAHGVTDPESAASRMVTGYAEMPFRPAFMEAMRRYFEALADIEGPSLIHCMAGKDRTGIAVALAHRALGVARDDWLADYMMTNLAGNIEARLAAGARHVRANFGEALGDDAVRVLMTVRPTFIDSSFAAMAERYGGIDGYFAACGIAPATIDRMRARLIV